jgi:hypothetical protein
MSGLLLYWFWRESRGSTSTRWEPLLVWVWRQQSTWAREFWLSRAFTRWSARVCEFLLAWPSELQSARACRSPWVLT